MSVSNNRIASIDILRGLVMVIMALDHTRDFFHNTAMIADPLNAETTTPALFFTRWITHFCAPVFVFLSGLSAYLSAQNKTAVDSSILLIKRGLWLVLAEVTLVTFGLTFNPYFQFVILQVIWAIGWSMVILGLLKRVSYNLVLIVGCLLVFAHNILDYVKLPSKGISSVWWSVLFTSRGAVFPINSNHFIGAFYAVLPWTGIMLLGYCTGKWFNASITVEERRKRLFVTGFLVTLLFIVLRASKGYGDPTPWNPDNKWLFSFLNASKYPPSLQFTCMTLGPAMFLLAFLEKAKSVLTGILTTYGKVPFFYFLLHFYILHILLAIVFFASGYPSKDILDPQSLFAFRPVKFGFNLATVYIIWAAVVTLLYLPCKWFNNYKMNHTYWWLKYI